MSHRVQIFAAARAILIGVSRFFPAGAIVIAGLAASAALLAPVPSLGQGTTGQTVPAQPGGGTGGSQPPASGAPAVRPADPAPPGAAAPTMPAPSPLPTPAPAGPPSLPSQGRGSGTPAPISEIPAEKPAVATPAVPPPADQTPPQTPAAGKQ